MFVLLSIVSVVSAQESAIDAAIRDLDARIAERQADIEELAVKVESAKVGELDTEPSAINFPKGSGSADFFVFDGAELVPADEIKSVSIAGKSYVQQMFTVERGSGSYNGITVNAVPDKVEAGTYKLEVRTTRGVASLMIETFGSTKPFVQSAPARDSFTFYLPDEYPLGSYLNLSTNGNREYHYTWTIDGTVVLEGAGKSTLRYILGKPGTTTVSVQERHSDGYVYKWEGATKVIPEASWPHSMRPGHEFAIDTKFLGLTDFAEHTWFLNGKNVGKGTAFKMKFTEPGTYSVTCRATKPTSADAKMGMREVTYKVSVK